MAGPQSEPLRSPSSRLSAAGWVAIVVLFLFLAGTAWYGIYAWTRLSGVAISPLGWLFMILSVVFTCLIGGGLMALVFYSSRHHYDR